MNNITCTPIVIQGSHWEIGQIFGELSSAAFPSFIEQSSTWRALQHWKGSLIVKQIRDNVMKHFPWVWEELNGMATSLNMDVLDLLLWNSRGDILHATQDGCTSVTSFSMIGDVPVPTCGHNEDGDPFLSSKCHIIDVRPPNSPRFICFFYPGSIPGHSFGFNENHVMHTVNNLRMKVKAANDDVWQLGIPRMVISRALLSCVSTTEAVNLLRNTRPIGGFHYTLCQQMSTPPPPPPSPPSADTGIIPAHLQVLSIEHTADMLSIIPLNPQFQFVHTNHTVHDELFSKSKTSAGSTSCAHPVREILKYSSEGEKQEEEGSKGTVNSCREVVTLSSLTRYHRACSITAAPICEKQNESSFSCIDRIKSVLTDTTDEDVNHCPIFRQQPDDPDEENTIVSVAFSVLSVGDSMHEPSSETAGDKGICQMSLFNFRENGAGAAPLITLTL